MTFLVPNNNNQSSFALPWKLFRIKIQHLAKVRLPHALAARPVSRKDNGMLIAQASFKKRPVCKEGTRVLLHGRLREAEGRREEGKGYSFSSFAQRLIMARPGWGNKASSELKTGGDGHSHGRLFPDRSDKRARI